MDSYAIARAESRIQDLESQIHRLKHDMKMSQLNEQSERTRSESNIHFWLWMIVLWGSSLFLVALAAAKKV